VAHSRKRDGASVTPGGTVSPFTSVLDPDVSDNPSFQDLLAHWNKKRAGRALPLREDFDPTEMRRHLGSLVLVECLPGLEDFRYRLIGTKVTQAYGRDSTGKTVRELYAADDPEYCDFMLDTYRLVVTRPVIARVKASLRPVRKDYRQADALLLPLAGSDGRAQWILNEVLFG
jgi:hypothetical protein